MAPAALVAAASAALPAPAVAQSVEELASLSIEELAEVEVQSASKRAEPVSGAPTSIYVITDEDIARSAATSLPEALRLAPNLQVQRVNAREYAVSARGFNGVESSNKLLVLLDGRTIYTPLHSGVFWELHSPLLEDINQVEVISGPGGTLFGPNAVNGVVNVTSRSALDTLGGLARATLGANERTIALRYGTALGASGAVRVYGNAYHREDMPDGPGPDVDDTFRGFQGGFRSDFDLGKSRLTFQGDLFESETRQIEGDGHRGHNLLARWSGDLSPASSFSIQAYYDYFRRRFTLVRDSLETFDVESQYNVTSGPHEFVAGAGLRTTRDEFINNLNPFVLVPERRRLWVTNAFVQDRIALAPELSVTAGLKLERSSFTGVQLLPNLRFAWQPTERAMFWAAVSRAVRTPSRIDRQLQFTGLLAPALTFQSEKLIAFEAGYRGRPAPRTSLSVSLFYNLYDDIRTTELVTGPAPIMLRNGLKGSTYGIEAWADQQVMPWWRLSLGLSTLSKDFRLKDGHNDLANGASLGMDPDFQILARSHMDLGDRATLTAGFRAVDDLAETGQGDYVEADARLGYRLTPRLELFVAGTGLLHATHLESADAARAQLIERSAYVGTRILF